MAIKFPTHDLQRIATVIAALEWWHGRAGPTPFKLRYLFESSPPLSSEDLSQLILEWKEAFIASGGIIECEASTSVQRLLTSTRESKRRERSYSGWKPPKK